MTVIENTRLAQVRKRPRSATTSGTPRPLTASDGSPLMIDIALIDEDPAQPRSKNNPGLRPESIAELAASYGPKGPKTPLSLRLNPDAPGRYIINHGHRRYRAGKLKGLDALPAFVDNDYDDADQVIENLQRESMTPREIADYIGRELAKGKKKGEIASRIGKSASFISQHVTLLDLPEPVAIAFRTGRVNDVTVVNELVSAFKLAPAEVTNWLNNPSQEMTRGEIKLLRKFLAEKQHDSDVADRPNRQFDSPVIEGHQDATSQSAKGQSENMRRFRPGLVKVEHKERIAHLLLTKRPHSTGRGWLRFEDDGQECDVALADVRLLAIVEA
ncbi:ParB/RepB/Spo0J family partition protein [Massilia sp. TW-1]|uniref:ParB/RepB/Spo0J family partition protein n=1 Tax=Telluria antibiotica TaxID=2717319 RepID=A0ABX0PI53_9BURK|nr:ParB/RepB/Spo0J family partition protein [Telluria antibiotica]NIA56974.1 ParB/RepB/Spo0J family partition protein [Telluria antibiotica]